ncbi:acyltransferase family protein [Marinicella meishanensis]|uniref:acyltransferase family protein n=1 Tax=Marinicella meishanensis TaxID=2873263 RepID=UPI001CBDB5A5|nr:acyltransferase [Marinicella sp. NBU2979]
MKSNATVSELKVLNTIRGLAALMVLVSHYSNSSKIFDRLLGQGGGQVGVMVFFVLSGFLIAYIYFHREINSLESKKYLLARAARVVPLYYLVSITSFIAVTGFDSRFTFQVDSVSDLAIHLFFLHGKSLLWTIPVEIQFYLLALLLWYLMQHRTTLFWLLVVTVLLVVFVWQPSLSVNWGPHDLTFAIIKSLPFFVAGAVLGAHYHRLIHWPKSHWWLLSMLLLPLMYPNIFTAVTGSQNTLWYSVTTWSAVLVFFVSWVFLLPASNRWVNNKVGDFLGQISYSMYLLHYPIILLMKPHLVAAPLLMFPVFLAVVLGLSWLVFHGFEKPAQDWLKRRFRPTS